VAEYSDHIKAQALAALLAGQTPAEVARLYHIPVGTLRSWKSRQQNGSSVAMIATESRERIGALLLEYLEVTLTTLVMQQKAFANAEWLHKQSAAEVATLHGISVDKAVRLLEGLADQDDGMGDDRPA
jgi:DNA-directed RNA polymerase specialized sigma24 family protein